MLTVAALCMAALAIATGQAHEPLPMVPMRLRRATDSAPLYPRQCDPTRLVALVQEHLGELRCQ